MGKTYRRSEAFINLLKKHSITFEDFKDLSCINYTQHMHRKDSAIMLADRMVTSLVGLSRASDKYTILVERITDQLKVGLHIDRQERSFKMNIKQQIKYEEKNRSLSGTAPPLYTFGLKDDKLERHLEIHRAGRTTLESDPFVADPFVTNPLHFPFLFVHADVDANSKAVEDQYAFPVWRLLGIQRTLQRHLVTKRFSTGPLVWTIAVCGTTVRIGGGYIKSEDGKVSSVITNFWESSNLGNRDDALRLVLMINYIARWAEKYCQDVYHALQPTEDKGEA